jgi:hypothetical protein
MSEKATNWRNALLAGAAFGLCMGLFAGVIWGDVPPRDGDGVVRLLTTILTTGLPFGLFFGLFANSKFVAKQVAIDLPPGESVEFATGANHFLNGEARGGRLYLTNRHLLFKPHRLNVQGDSITIPRVEIASAEATRTLGVVPNGLKITRSNGAAEQFVVNSRAEWLRRLAGAD